ncbi:hypothetical protein FRC14_004881 [Serendipita sp. 396]|nr:hypothetical protein FRC14_004881 [Serendipita sp. 396]KAG8781508.1 hypothetical protein FRC15_008614 [Serendipita sp. 397]KAG8866394.1 hypothetical protein FRC20_008645 [Serendipita sp. 405]
MAIDDYEHEDDDIGVFTVQYRKKRVQEYIDKFREEGYDTDGAEDMAWGLAISDTKNNRVTRNASKSAAPYSKDGKKQKRSKGVRFAETEEKVPPAVKATASTSRLGTPSQQAIATSIPAPNPKD